MFQWYKDSVVCYAYLADVSDIKERESTDFMDGESADFTNSGTMAFQRSKWFTRGWTLQELLAPKHLIFIGNRWNILGTKSDLGDVITSITKIPRKILNGATLNTVATACKMSWVSGRVTTRPEDIAYCLLGLFDVNMP